MTVDPGLRTGGTESGLQGSGTHSLQATGPEPPPRHPPTMHHRSSPRTRRRFLQLTAASSAAAAFRLPGATDATDADGATAALYQRIVPAAKRLDPAWVASLARRGHPLDAPVRGSRREGTLDKIGMTVGGIACGTVYLNGDGRLFVWDIFNQHHEGVVANRAQVPESMRGAGADLQGGGGTVTEPNGANFISAPTPDSFPNGFVQDFALEAGGRSRPLDASGWAEVEFDGRWPLGSVRYRDPAAPLEARLDAWSPFIPLQLDDSSLPVTVVEVTLHNPGPTPVAATVTGRLGNPVCRHSLDTAPVELRSETARLNGATALVHTAVRAAPAADPRPDVRFAGFEDAGYGDWQAQGEAFGGGPVALGEIPAYQGDVNGVGGRVVNSHASAPGAGVAEKDAATGTLTSPEFTIERRFIRLRVGGGNHPGKTCVNLLVDGRPVRSITGAADNRMREAAIPTAGLEGRRARLQVVDAVAGAWGNIGVDEIVFSDTPPPAAAGAVEELPDFGSMALAALGEARCDGREALAVALDVPAGGEACVRFLLAWHFPNLHPLPGLGRRRRHYAARFPDAAAVAAHVAAEFDRLAAGTRAWVETYYESSIPRWLLDRAAAPVNTLQTANCILLDDGRFWAWEGIGCCAGTCAHVWHYAQGPARLFPALERNLREVTDFGVALNPDGAVRFRAESGGIAVDAQAGVVLRTWREHLCSADDAFLARTWPAVKRVLGWLLEFDRRDPDGLNGLLDGEQHNTLDAEWYGKVPCLCSLYLAALRAGEEMARAVGDAAFADGCRATWRSGSEKIGGLFNGEFYEQAEDPRHLDKIGVGKGCYIDQVIGQWWAHQTGLGRICDEGHVKSALHALWKHNFLPDVGPFRAEFTRGRFYALPGDAGLVMCTWPRGGLRDEFRKHWQCGYFNECMTGFEWQAAAHMVMEGAPVSGAGFEPAIEDAADPRALTLRGLAVARAIHDRYAPAKRNPYNEIECSDHYARAAASWSLLLAVSGFHHHGPRGEIGFAPRLDPEDFRCPFTAAEGWGTFHQQRRGGAWNATLAVRHGRLRLRTLRLPWLGAEGVPAARWNGREVSRELAPGRITFKEGLVLEAGDTLTLGEPAAS